jgi:hypothetical protein
MSVCEAFLFAMCLQQQYDFLVISAVYIVVGMIIVVSVSTLLFLLSGIYPFSAVNPGCFIHMN